MRLTERIPCHSQSETTLEDFHVGGLPSQNVTNPHGHSISTLRRLQLSSIQGPNHRCWCPYLTKSRRGLGGALRWVDLPSLAGKRDGSIMKYLRIEHSDRLWLDEISMNINKTYNHATPHQHRDSWHYFHWKLEALLHITHYISVYSRHDQFAVVCWWHQSNRMAWGNEFHLSRLCAPMKEMFSASVSRQGRSPGRVSDWEARKLPTQALKMKIWSDALVT